MSDRPRSILTERIEVAARFSGHLNHHLAANNGARILRIEVKVFEESKFRG